MAAWDKLLGFSQQLPSVFLCPYYDAMADGNSLIPVGCSPGGWAHPVLLLRLGACRQELGFLPKGLVWAPWTSLGLCWGFPGGFPMAATSNSLNSGETPGQQSDSCGSVLSSSPPSPGRSAGTNPVWGLLVWGGGASPLEKCLQTQPGPLPWPWGRCGVRATSLWGGRPALGTCEHVLAVATSGLATPSCSFAHANPRCVGCDVPGASSVLGWWLFFPRLTPAWCWGGVSAPSAR